MKANVTDRAKRYRAQKNVTGPKRCVLCGSRENIGVMHLSGFEDDGASKNLAWGCKSCNGWLASAFKKFGMGKPTNQYNPAKSKVPTFEQYAWAVSQQNHSGEHGQAGAIIHATPKSKRIEYARRIAEKAGRTKAERFADRWNPTYTGHKMTQAERDAAYEQEDREQREAEKHAEWVRAQEKRSLGRKRNPAESAAEAFEEFHGYPSTETIKVESRRHFHRHVAAAGELVGVEVRPWGKGLADRVLEFGDDCFLTFNEAKNQLFITGGDQRMSRAELKKFGCDVEHELYTVGKLIAVGYYTDKKHLGKEGGEAIYSHTFRTTNENGVHITVKLAKYPDLIYRALDEQFEISGGSYLIRREGIDK